jgi:hypothetical protein
MSAGWHEAVAVMRQSYGSHVAGGRRSCGGCGAEADGSDGSMRDVGRHHAAGGRRAS